jgi:hypothetical protein
LLACCVHELLDRSRNVKAPPAAAHVPNLDEACFAGVGRRGIVIGFRVGVYAASGISSCSFTIAASEDVAVVFLVVM